MTLHVAGLVEEPPYVGRRVESPTPGVVLVDVWVTESEGSAQLHWFASSGRKPPMDIALGFDGRFRSVQFVLQDEFVPGGSPPVPSDMRPGVPTFDVVGWPADRYRDERIDVRAERVADGRLALTLPAAAAPTWGCRPGLGLDLAFTADGALAQLVIGPLATSEWATAGEADV